MNKSGMMNYKLMLARLKDQIGTRLKSGIW